MSHQHNLLRILKSELGANSVVEYYLLLFIDEIDCGIHSIDSFLNIIPMAFNPFRITHAAASNIKVAVLEGKDEDV